MNMKRWMALLVSGWMLSACAAGGDGDTEQEGDASFEGSVTSSSATTGANSSSSTAPSTSTGGTGGASAASSSTTATASSSSSGGGAGETTPICDSGFVLGATAEDQKCAACLGALCCVEHKACGSDQNCLSCLVMNDANACNATIKDEAVMLCATDLCMSPCAHLLGG